MSIHKSADSLDREPLLLLHGVTMSSGIWDAVVPLLEAQYRIVAPTALGHHGGPAASRRPTSIQDMVDDAEAAMDTRGAEKMHLAGNSMGGWIALELARRGRALSVCALSPAGFWVSGERSQTHGTGLIKKSWTMARAGRPITSTVMRSARIRQFATKTITERGDQLTRAQAIGISRDLLKCTVTGDLLTTTEQFEPMPQLPCPVTIAWSGRDRVFPQMVNDAIARERIPEAHFETLPGVGHVPMIDDPEVVARTIVRATARARREA